MGGLMSKLLIAFGFKNFQIDFIGVVKIGK